MSTPWLLGDGDKTVGTQTLRSDYIYDQLAQKLALAGIVDQSSFSAFASYLGFSGGGPPPSFQDMQVSWSPSTIKLGEQIGFFTFGNLAQVPAEITFHQTSNLAGFDLEFTGPCLIHFPNLVSIDPLDTQGGYLSVSSSVNLTCDLPALTTIGGGLFASASTNLTLDAPALAIIGQGLSVNNSTNISLNLASLITIGEDLTANNSTITALNLPLWLPTDGTQINFNGSNLTASMVEQILSRCVASGVSTCIIIMNGGTNAGLASLSAQGQADAATLGAQLTINP